MTKRYSIEDVAQMLQCDGELVREVVSSLHSARVLSAETFLFAGGAWRIAPSDVIKIQLRLATQDDTKRAETAQSPRQRLVKRTRADREGDA